MAGRSAWIAPPPAVAVAPWYWRRPVRRLLALDVDRGTDGAAEDRPPRAADDGALHAVAARRRADHGTRRRADDRVTLRVAAHDHGLARGRCPARGGRRAGRRAVHRADRLRSLLVDRLAVGAAVHLLRL